MPGQPRTEVKGNLSHAQHKAQLWLLPAHSLAIPQAGPYFHPVRWEEGRSLMGWDSTQIRPLGMWLSEAPLLH